MGSRNVQFPQVPWRFCCGGQQSTLGDKVGGQGRELLYMFSEEAVAWKQKEDDYAGRMTGKLH